MKACSCVLQAFLLAKSGKQKAEGREDGAMKVKA